MVYLKYVENVIPLSKLIGLLFSFCLPFLSILFLKTKRNDLARPVMGTIFLVYICRYDNKKNVYQNAQNYVAHTRACRFSMDELEPKIKHVHLERKLEQTELQRLKNRKKG